MDSLRGLVAFAPWASGAIAYGLLLALCGACDSKPASSQTTPEQPSSSAAPSASVPAPSASVPAPSIAPLYFAGNSVTDESRKRTELPDERFSADAKVVLDPAFVMKLVVGGWSLDTHVTTIAASGAAWHSYEDSAGKRREVEFSVTRRELDELVQVLNDNRFLQLSKYYIAPVHDGVYWELSVVTRGREKWVHLSNEFPLRAVHVARFVKGMIDRRPDLSARSRFTPSYRRFPLFVTSHDAKNPPDCVEPAPGLTIEDDVCVPPYAEVYFTGGVPPKDSKVELTLHQGAELIAREIAKPGNHVILPYDPKRIALDRPYSIRVRVQRKGKVLLASPPLPALTFGRRATLVVPYPRD